MEKNKSIDGLSTRRSKKTADSNLVIKPKKAKTVTKPKPVLKPRTAPKSKTSVKPKASVKPKTTAKTKKPAPKPKKSPKAPAVTTGNFLEPVKAFDFDEETGSLEAAKPKKVKKVKKKASKPRKIASIIALVIVLILGGLVLWAILWGNDIIAKITGGQGNLFDLLFNNETYEPLKTDENGRTNILAFGTSGYNMDGDVGDGVHDGAALTDSIMAISLNQETGDIAMISLPRDLKAGPTCTATGKINEVYWCNNIEGDNEQAGAEALMSDVGTILGIDFQYYAHVNWSSVVQIVDTLGGITITMDEDVLDYYGTGYSYYAGETYNLDGNQALILSRARYGTMGGDFTRSNNQQKILIGIKNRVLEKNLSIADYLSLAGTLGDNLRTNFSIDELKSLAHLTYEFNFDSMRQISLLEPEPLLTTGMIDGISYVFPTAGIGNYGRIQNYVARMISTDPRIYEEPNILILNGTETDGLASTEKNSLEQEGYRYIDVDNAPDGSYPEKYSIYSSDEKPGTKELLEQYYNTTPKSYAELPENVSRDYDFVIILGGETND